MKPAKKILAIKLRKLSEMIVWTGALQALRNAYPDAQIDLLVPEELSHVYKDFPLVQNIHSVPQEGRFAFLKKLWSLRREHYDLALAFDTNSSVNRWMWALRAKETCIHDHTRLKKPFWSSLAVDNLGELADNLHLDSKVLLALGIQERMPLPKMFVSERLRKQAFERLNFKFDQSESKRKVVLLPGAELETKRYPRDLWLQTLDRISKEKNWLATVIADRQLSESWGLRKECFRRGIRLYDELSLHDLLAYLSWFEVAVVNDSAPLHLASAMGVRTVTLFGPGNLGREHGYPDDAHEAIRAAVDCRPEGPRENVKFQYCLLTQCSHLSCLRKIEPSEVLQGVSSQFEAIQTHRQRAAKRR
jgi:ADP-heptose:LPS heptosyltransferase